MNYKFSPLLSQTNEASYRTINYPNINSLSIIQNHSKQNTETNSTNKSPKLLYHLTIHRPLMNNKKDLFLDEDDTDNLSIEEIRKQRIIMNQLPELFDNKDIFTSHDLIIPNGKNS